MLKKNDPVMKNIQQLSLSLSAPQLEKFVTIIESLAELLQVANEDTEKAYKMYLNSIQSPKEKVRLKSKLIPTQYGTTNVVPIKH